MKDVNNFLLSIIIPVLITENNKMEKYLQRCIDSLLKQKDFNTFVNQFEVIIVDDHSYDQTLVDQITFGPIHYTILKNKTNLGIGGARNVGLDNANGKWIWYFDGDDYFKDDCLTRLFRNISVLTNDVKLVFTQFDSLKNVNNQDIYEHITLKDLPNYATTPVSSCCKLIRKDIAVKHPEHVYMEDVVFHYKQLDVIDKGLEVAIFNDGPYWIYDLRRETNFTRTSLWLQMNKLTIEQHLRNGDFMEKQGLKRRAISDTFRLVAELFDLIPLLKHDLVRNTAASRLVHIVDKIKCENYTH